MDLRANIKLLIFVLLYLCVPFGFINAQTLGNYKGLIVDGNRIIVKETVNLQGRVLQVPENFVLFFDEGSIENGTLILNKTTLSGDVSILSDFKGTVTNEELKLGWFGVKPNTNQDQTNRVQQVLNLFTYNVPLNPWDVNLLSPEPKIEFPAGRFYLGEIQLRSYITIRGQGRGSTELRGVRFVAENQYNMTIEDISLFGKNIDLTEILSGSEEYSAFHLKNCGGVLFKNISVRNYHTAYNFFNTVLSDFYSCNISYCNIGFCNDGSGSGYGGHALRWYGGHICNCNIGFTQRMGCGVAIIGTTIEKCYRAIDLVYPISFSVLASYFEANTFDIYGNVVHTNIEDCFFSDAHKTNDGTYIYAESIGFSIIRGNKFNSQISTHPYIETKINAPYYRNLSITQNDLVGGKRMVVSDLISDAIDERGRLNYQQYLPDGTQLFMGQLVMYKDPKSNKYYIVTRDELGNLLYIPTEYMK